MNPPGVPTLQNAGVTFNQVSTVVSDIAIIAGLFSGPQWGIFDQNNNPVIVGDSVVSAEFTRDFNISKYPVEQGDFASYNKVKTPYGLKFTFTKGGSISDRANFLKTVQAAQASLTLYKGSIPELFYPNITIDHYDWRRTAKNGVTLLTVDVWCEEVRVAPPASFSSTPTTTVPPITAPADPQAGQAVNGGTVQAQPPASQVSTPSAPIAGTGQTSPATISTP